MNDLFVATTNKGKIREIRSALSPHFKDLSLFNPGDFGIIDSPPETGETLLENSIEKSLFYSSLKNGILTIADDSGLMVDSLNGSPGINSARYSGSGQNDLKNIEKLLNELKDIHNRDACFVSVITLSRDGSVISSFRGEVRGEIIDDKRGENGFGYDPVFYYPPLNKTFAELTGEEKNTISHRAAALIKLKDYLNENPELF